MSGLVKKCLVTKSNNLPARYSLTIDGRKLATKLLYGTEDSDDPGESDSENIKNRQKIQKTSNILSPVKEVLILPKQSKTADLIEICSSDDTSDNGIIAIDEHPVTSFTNYNKKTYQCIDSSSSDDELPDIGPTSTCDSSPAIQYEEYTNPKVLKNLADKKPAKLKSILPVQQSQSRSSQSQLPQTETISANSFNINMFKKSCSKTVQMNDPVSGVPELNFSLQAGTYDLMLFVDNCEQTA